jgi:hypothetical protein
MLTEGKHLDCQGCRRREPRSFTVVQDDTMV